MKRNILLVASGSFLALSAVSVAAQEVPPADATVETEVTTEVPTANGQGATVTHETTTTTETDADGAPVATTTDTINSVETPAGNTTTVSRIEGEDGRTATTVDHSKMDHSQHPMPAEEKPKNEPEAN